MTDIEGSTERWEREPVAMRAALATHDAVLREVIEKAGGYLFKHTGDGVVAAFGLPRAAVEAAIAAQRRLQLPVRMGLCTGEAELRDGDYFGPVVNRAARIMSAGHGGQVLLAGTTAALLDAIDLADLGEHRLRGLSQRVHLFQIRAPGLQASFPPLVTLDAATGNLPAQTTALLGRESDLTEIAHLMQIARLVTLTGVGGVGKTRLACEVALMASGTYPDGAWLVELAALGESAAVEHAIAGVLGVTPSAGKSVGESLVEALSGRQLLLVLDNCEHLIEAVATLARAILARCPRIRLLATSREALSIEGERVWTVAPLTVAAGINSPAVLLFAERARAVAPTFDLTRDAEAAIEICRRLDGIPLAIELAAARTRTMSVRQIRDRLNERFRLLAGGARRALDRHQTLRHAVQWSYDLLMEAERRALMRLSVFAGGFNLEAAEQVCVDDDVASEDVLGHLDSLVRKSLVTVELSGEVARYELLETIRQFAEEQAAAGGLVEAMRARHATFFATEADSHFRLWLSPRQHEAYEWLDREMGNLRAAFRWARDCNQIDLAARIASDIGDMARFRLRPDAAEWAGEIVDAAREAQHRRLVRLLTWAASSAWAAGDRAAAKRYGREAVSLLGDPRFEPFTWAYMDLSFVAIFEGDIASGLNFARQGAAQAADALDRFCAAFLPYLLALAGQYEEAMRIADATITEVRKSGVPGSIGIALYSKGHAFSKTYPAQALSAFEAALLVAKQSGNRLWESLIAIEIAALQARGGDPETALRTFSDMLQAWRGASDTLFVSHGFGSLIVLFDRLGCAEAAATLFGAMGKLFDKSAFVTELGEAMTRAREQLGAEAFESATRCGAGMAIFEASDYARVQIDRLLERGGSIATP